MQFNVFSPEKCGSNFKHIIFKFIVQNGSFVDALRNYSQMNTKEPKLEQLECLRSEIPPATPWLPILVIRIRSQVKTWQSQSYKFKKIAKNHNFEIVQPTLHLTHLLELLDKMNKYKMDPTRTVGTTEQDTGCRTDRRSETNIPPEWNQYTSPTTSLCGGIIMRSQH